MKPVLTNSISAIGYIGLILLFNLPYVGLPAMLICAFFVKSSAVRSLARAFLIIELFALGLLVVFAILGFISFSDILQDFYFDFPADGGVEALGSIIHYLGV